MRIAKVSLVVGLVTLLGSNWVQAQEGLHRLEKGVENRYRVGLGCEKVSEALRMHLKLPEGTGLLVSAVMDDSPAGRAGIQRFDVIVEANGNAVTDVPDLIRAVNEARETEMQLGVVHRGERKTFRVTPEQRSQEEIDQIRRRGPLPGMRGFGTGNFPPDLRQYLENFEEFELPGRPGFSGRRFLPGIMMDDPKWLRQELPNNFSMKIEKLDDGPAKIKVKRGDQEWTVSEEDLEDLPEDLRPLVENMLSGSRQHVFGLTVPEPQVPWRSRQRPKQADDTPRIEKRFDGLELQLKELQDAIRVMQEERN